SSAATPSASERILASSTYSSSVVPQMLTMTDAPSRCSSGSFSAMNRWTPMPCRPIALSMPDGVSTMRGGGCPSRSARNSPFTATPPSDDRSTMSPYSTPYPKQPLAAINGLASVNDPMETERSISVREGIPDDAVGVEDGSVDARADEMRDARRVAGQHHAAVAPAETAAHHLFERDIARPAMRGGKLGHGAHHRCRSADIQPHVAGARQPAKRRGERRRDETSGAAAAVFRGEHR